MQKPFQGKKGGDLAQPSTECSHCGQINRPENQFCVQCGDRLIGQLGEEEPQGNKETGGRGFSQHSVPNFIGHVFAMVLLSGLTAFIIQSLRPASESDGHGISDEVQARLLLKNIRASAESSGAIRISQSQANQLLRLLVPEQQFDVPSIMNPAFQRLWVNFNSGIAECILTTRINFLRLDLAWKVRPVLRGNGFYWEVLGGSLGKVLFPPFLAEILAAWILPPLSQLPDTKQLLDMATSWQLEPGLCDISWRPR